MSALGEYLLIGVQLTVLWKSAQQSYTSAQHQIYMIIGSRQRLKNLDHVPKISINGHQIERVYKKEVFGIVIDVRLSCNRQNEEQCNKISKNINLLRKAKDFVGLDTLKIM